jgi:hypothetical protein
MAFNAVAEKKGGERQQCVAHPDDPLFKLYNGYLHPDIFVAYSRRI